MIITAIVTIRGLATEAEYGTSSAFYYIVGAIIFFIPTALVVAELTMMFQDTEGGVATWIGKALGMKYGLVSIWLQWIASMISFPALLIVGSVSIAYIGTDMASDSLLASNKIYTFIIIQSMYWIATIIALNGMKWISKVSKIGGLIGTIIPIVVLIVCAILFLIMGGDSQINFSHDYIPKISGINQLVLASCVFSFYSGMEIISADRKSVV